MKRRLANRLERAVVRLAWLWLTVAATLMAAAPAQAAPFAYVANWGDDTLFQYETGALSPKSPATVDTFVGPSEVVVTPDGKSAYVTNSGGRVSQYDVGAGGALKPK
jgi:DNA-binding beta-propeller fold protein YncE